MRSIQIVFCFTVLLGLNLLGVLEALKSGEDGVCVVKISIKKTRSRMVTINKWCGKKKCVKKKIETYTVPEERIVCCNGWEYLVQTDSCGPICSTGCVGGHCVSPEVCQCDPPATLDPEHKNTCIQPICNHPCVNAQCQGNNSCECLPNFLGFNATHCYKCDEGYSINEDFNCTPKCDQNCTNGFCSAPNICTCNEGYRIVNGTCEPICDVCVNSTCSAPNECECLEGYKEVNKTTCVPKCEDCDGDCVGPNVCVCHEGYTDVGGSCRPVCVGCINGVCSGPGQCTCSEGFVKNDSNPNECVRSCARPSLVEER